MEKIESIKSNIHEKIVKEERGCEKCTACCKTHSVLSIDKEMGVWCKNCDIGKGCRIYHDKPEECNDFACQWLKGYGEKKDRPDKTKIVIDFYEAKELGEKIASLWEVSQGALEQDYAKITTQELLASDIPVLHVCLNGKKVLYIKKVLTKEKHKLLTEGGIEIVQQ